MFLVSPAASAEASMAEYFFSIGKKAAISFKTELERNGHKVVIARCETPGVSELVRQNIDLIVLDVVSAGMDRLECLNRILQRKRNVRIIINTDHPELQHDFGTWGADLLIRKNHKTGR